MLDVFGGPGFLAKATNHLGLLGYVLDTKFGLRYDVTMTTLLVLTRIRQDVAAVKGVAGMISPPRRHTPCSPKVVSASAPVANFLRRVRMTWFLEHPCDSWLSDVPKIQTLAVQLARTAWALADFCGLDHHAGSERCLWLGTPTTEIGTVLLAVFWNRCALQCVSSKTCSSRGFSIT